MKVLRPEDYSPKPTCAAVGSFDGLHVAHRYIISLCTNSPYRSMVITFRTHPSRDEGLLFTPEEKLNALEGMGVDAVLLLEREHKSIPPEDFMEMLITHFHVKRILMGFDHRFGRDRRGSAEWLVRNVKRYPVELHLFPPITHNGKVVSSSLIRSLLREGKVEEASLFLGRHYSLTGKVVKGEGKGREIGFPTANLKVWGGKLVPKDGVYVVFLEEMRRWGVLHVGPRPTLGLDRSIEIHVLDYSGDVPGSLTVKFVKRLRDPQKFDSVAALRRQIGRDISAAKEFISKLGRGITVIE